MHCVHRNPAAPAGFTNERMVFDSVVHEMDIIPWLAGEPISAVEVRYPKKNRYSEEQLHDPQLILVETQSGVLADIEINVNAHFGYQVRTEAVFERGVAEIGRTAGLAEYSAGAYRQAESAGFESRFGAAYDAEVQAWVHAARRGATNGPTAWDGYLAAAAVDAGILAQKSGERVAVEYAERPPMYESQQ